MTDDLEFDEATKEASALAKEVGNVLQGRDPFVIGMALSDIVAIHFATLDPKIRSRMRATFNRSITNMVPVVVDMMIKNGDVPKEWHQKPWWHLL